MATYPFTLFSPSRFCTQNADKEFLWWPQGYRCLWKGLSSLPCCLASPALNVHMPRRPWRMLKSEHAQGRSVRTRKSSRSTIVDILGLPWARSDTGLCCDHSVLHNDGISRLSASWHRHLGSCRPEQGRKVDRAPQRDVPEGAMLSCVLHHQPITHHPE